ncbi:SDR family NAD(P)-dependent oxidoreductase [Nocardia rhizosphaerihabitans]
MSVVSLSRGIVRHHQIEGPMGVASTREAPVTTVSGRTAIVTGGSLGVGVAAAKAIDAAGGNVVLIARSQEAADATAAEVGGNAVGMAARAVDQAAAQRCVDAAIERFGSIDILINTAGTNHARGRIIDQDYLRFTKTCGVTLWEPILWTSLVARAWMSEHGGVVVNTIGETGSDAGLGLYAAANAALLSLTEQLAVELSPTVRVDAVVLDTAQSEYAGSATAPAPSGEHDVGDAIVRLVSYSRRVGR